MLSSSSMEALLRQVKSSYPSTEPRITTYDVTKQTIQSIYRHFQEDSTYTKDIGITGFLSRCTHHVIVTAHRITLHVVAPFEDLPSRTLLRRVVRRAQCLIKMHECAHPMLEFWLLPMRTLRFFPKDGVPVEGKHINGGFTFPANGKVFIFRFEEFPKVMLHETIHNLDIDTYEEWSHDELMDMYDHWNISRRGCDKDTGCETLLVPNEAIVETWAELYQVAFLSIEYHIDWKRLLQAEKDWAIMQAKLVLDYQRKHMPVWNEKTHAYSYIVLRSCLLWNHNRFLNMRGMKWSQLIRSSFYNDDYQKALKSARLRTNVMSMRNSIFGGL